MCQLKKINNIKSTIHLCTSSKKITAIFAKLGKTPKENDDQKRKAIAERIESAKGKLILGKRFQSCTKDKNRRFK
jgi:hypothetical protein